MPSVTAASVSVLWIAVSRHTHRGGLPDDFLQKVVDYLVADGRHTDAPAGGNQRADHPRTRVRLPRSERPLNRQARAVELGGDAHGEVRQRLGSQGSERAGTQPGRGAGQEIARGAAAKASIRDVRSETQHRLLHHIGRERLAGEDGGGPKRRARGSLLDVDRPALAIECLERAERLLVLQLLVPATYVQATPDLMMGDLLKNMRSSQIFSVCGHPEVRVHKAAPAAQGGAQRYQVELLGLDTFDPTTMEVDHRPGDDVPAWFLDVDYNESAHFKVSQAFFPRNRRVGRPAEGAQG